MTWHRFFRRKYWDLERAREVEAYLEMETAENIARGMAAAEARNRARRKLGNSTLIREEIYRMNSIGFVETLWQDLRYASRVLRKSPGFTLIAVLSLALGIGANTAVFSVVHAVLLRPLPYPDPGRIVRVSKIGARIDSVSMPELEFWKEHSTSLTSAAGQQGTSSHMLVSGDKTEWIETMPVTGDFLRTLEISPALGREFTTDETRRGGPRAIILSDRLWRHVFHGDPATPGHVVTVDNQTYTVAGVLPATFWYPVDTDALVPLRTSGTVGDEGANTEMIARLKPGVTLEQAQAEMAALAPSFRGAAAGREDYHGLTATRYSNWLAGDVRTKLLLLFGAVGLLLLIACTNLASLLLARLAGRQKEIALRLALGSGSARLLRQFLTENILLGAGGAAAGLLAARWLLGGFLAAVPFKLPASGSIGLDLPVLAFTLAIALGTSLIFSLAPFLTTSRLDVNETLKSSGRSSGKGSARARSFLVVSEVALSVTLLVGAALLIHSLYRIYHERLGFDPHGLMTFRTPASSLQRRTVAQLRAFDADLADRLSAMPGVQSVAAVSVLPLTSQANFPAQREGHPEQSIGGMEIRHVSPSYFVAMGMPVVLGRSLSARDTVTALPVIVVNETVARTWWGNGSPLGDRVQVGMLKGRDLSGGEEKPREVVGVVADTKSIDPKKPPRPTIYLASAQTPWYDYGMNWVVRGNLTAGFAGQLRQVVAEIDPRQKVDRLRTMDEIVSATTTDTRFDAWLFGIFAVLALVLTSVGVYGLLAFSVARRTNEIGTRMALGASSGQVLRLVLKEGFVLTAIGLAVGLAGALALTRMLSTLLFGVTVRDPVSFVGVSGLLIAVGLVASYLPARRATKVDPLVALRNE